MMDNLGGKLGSFDRIERGLAEGQAWSGFDRGIDGSAYFRDRAA
jgi:3'-5' exoribonuclease